MQRGIGDPYYFVVTQQENCIISIVEEDLDIVIAEDILEGSPTVEEEVNLKDLNVRELARKNRVSEKVGVMGTIDVKEVNYLEKGPELVQRKPTLD